MVPAQASIERFEADLDALIEPASRFGIAVSGGPDSLALLLLCAAARPGDVEAATVDHGLRPENRAEAEKVADLCAPLGVPHATLRIDWDLPPSSAIQEQAREVRYGALARWMDDRGLTVLVAGHQLDDQAETLLMRLRRGAGARGLAGMRPLTGVPGRPDLQLARPLLGWRRTELEQVCADAAVAPVRDPSNEDERHERVRVRRALAEAGWLDPESLARSASHLAEADDAIEWAAALEWTRFAEYREGEIAYRPSNAPNEILRRIAARAVAELGSEGSPDELRGGELDRLVEALVEGRTVTLRGVRCSGDEEWRFAPAAKRSRLNS